jgi:hypothetical protein
MSVDLRAEHKGSAFAGLYTCKVDTSSGNCFDPEVVVDRWDVNGTHHIGLDLMNVCMISNSVSV